ncbi:ATP-binding protein [Spirochaeta dissipatitropha]
MPAADFFWRDTEQLLSSLVQILPGISGKPVSVNQAFRYVHSIRSQAEYLRISELICPAGDLEDKLGALRLEKAEIEGDELAELCRVAQDLQQIFLQLKETGGESSGAGSRDIEALVDSRSFMPAENDSDLFSRLIDGADQNTLRHAVRTAERNAEHMYWLHLKLREQPEFRKHRKYLILHTVEQNLHVCLNSDIDDGSSDDFAVLFSGKQDEEEVNRLLRSSGIKAMQLQRLEFKQFLQRIGESPACDPGLLGQADRVNLSLSSRSYESFLLGLHLIRERFDERSRAISQELLGLLSASGMVPITDIISELVPMTEQLADQQKKMVQCRLMRSEEKVPATVASVLREALVHLLRNAVDHGIELPQERLRKGKKAAGTLRIELSTDEDWLDILIQDDGRGISIPGMPEDTGELLDMLCQPGFSSVAGGSTVNSGGSDSDPGSAKSSAAVISGRGVGMDAVRHSIENLLHGKIELITSAVSGQEGTGFLLRIPRNPAVLSVLIVRDLKQELWAIPGLCIYDRFRLSSNIVNQSADLNLYCQYEDRMIPLHDPDGSRKSSLPENQLVQAVRLAYRGCEHLLVITEAIAEEGVVLSADRVFSELLQKHVQLWDPWEFIERI